MKKELPKGAFIKDGDMYVRTGEDFTSMSVYDFALKGKHNQYNTMAACVAAINDGYPERKDPGSGTEFSKPGTPDGTCGNHPRR